MASQCYHSSMDRAYGSMIMDIYKKYNDGNENVKSIINEVMETFGGMYEKLPGKWINDNIKNDDYSLFNNDLSKVIKLALEDKNDQKAVVLFWKMFICYIHIILNEDNCNNFNFSEISDKIYNSYISKINTQSNEMYEGFKVTNK